MLYVDVDIESYEPEAYNTEEKFGLEYGKWIQEDYLVVHIIDGNTGEYKASVEVTLDGVYVRYNNTDIPDSVLRRAIEEATTEEEMMELIQDYDDPNLPDREEV